MISILRSRVSADINKYVIKTGSFGCLFQSEDKVFRLRQRKRNAGRFVVLAIVGVVYLRGVLKNRQIFGVPSYGRGRERLGVPLSARSKLWGFPAKGNDGGHFARQFN